MTIRPTMICAALLLSACATDTATDAPYDPLQDYEELEATTVLDAPRAVPGNYAPENRDQVERGEYLVELLGCGACHTDGALEGAPNMERALAGSRIGIAYINPLANDKPGVIYPPNITPDIETGIGGWSDRQIQIAIRAGIGKHGDRRIRVMPWQAYSRLNREDLGAVVAYLRSVPAVRFEVPAEVRPGETAKYPFVYFGVYRSRK